LPLRGAADAATPRRREALSMTATRTNLTPRERQVATLLAYGLTNTEIADRLQISIRTAEMHRANAMRKLGTQARAGVVRWALDNGLLR
jgi:DNA-binding CsgD family transcriptional regulator